MSFDMMDGSPKSTAASFATEQKQTFEPGGVVFSSTRAFNPTTLAVQTSLEDALFNPTMERMIIEGLRLNPFE